uniref:Uncharacterized protein n=1 Tax=Plectus sambesii TaxID=2011161 RepID=A0A914X291_9BILA
MRIAEEAASTWTGCRRRIRPASTPTLPLTRVAHVQRTPNARSDIPCPKCRQGARATVFGNVLAPISRIIRLVCNASLTSFTPAAVHSRAHSGEKLARRLIFPSFDDALSPTPTRTEGSKWN